MTSYDGHITFLYLGISPGISVHLNCKKMCSRRTFIAALLIKVVGIMESWWIRVQISVFPELCPTHFQYSKSQFKFPVWEIKGQDATLTQRKCPLPNFNNSRPSQSNTGQRDVSFKTKEGNLFERRSCVMGALLISSQIKSQLFARNKDSQWGNQPPKGQMVSAQSPLTPPALALSDRAARVPGHPANSQSTLFVQSVYSHVTVLYLSDSKSLFFHRMFCSWQPWISDKIYL